MEGNEPRKERPNVLITLAAVVIVIAGLRAGADVLLPILSALFLSILCIPPMKRLQRFGLPDWASVVVVSVGVSILFVAVTAIVGSSVDEFQNQLPLYKFRLNEITGDVLGWLQEQGMAISIEDIQNRIDTSQIMQLAGDTVQALLGVVSNGFLVLLTVVFMLLEANGFRDKLRRARGEPDSDLSDVTKATEQIQKYLAIKTFVSAVTSIGVAVLLWALDVDFVLLWAMLAFLFNYVPNIGSLIAAVPAVLLALIQHGGGTAIAASIGFFAINMIVGNALEPRLMGRRLGLSTLVVFLSLIFWGWVWGNLGMLLSVPLTVIVKIALEQSEDFKGFAVLLGPPEELETF